MRFTLIFEFSIMKSFCLFVLLLLPIKSESVEVDGFPGGAISLVTLAESIYKPFDTIQGQAENTDPHKRLLAEYQMINSSLARLEINYDIIERNTEMLEHALSFAISAPVTMEHALSFAYRNEIQFKLVNELIYSIRDAYNRLNTYKKYRDQWENFTLENFAKHVSRFGEGSIISKLEKLHELIKLHGTLVLIASHIMDDPYFTCSLGKSPFHFVFDFYNILLLTEIKGYATIQFSPMLLRRNGNGSFLLSELERKTFETRFKEILNQAEKLLPTISRKYRRCDPKNQTENATFIRMTNFLQGHVENEVDMNAMGSCGGQCSDYKILNISNICYDTRFCSKQPKCENGRLFECKYFAARATICLSEQKERKFDWIKYDDGKVLGKKGECRDRQHRASSWLRGFWDCSYCLCKCDSPSNSDRYWSLRPALSDISANMVITGVRFVKKMGIIHIEVQEAKATEQGSVNETERHWIETEGFDVNHLDVTEGTDYMMMDFENRAINLDVIEGPNGTVVTGIRLKRLQGHLYMEIRVTEIDFFKGQLKPELSTWISHVDDLGKKSLLKLEDADVPINFNGLNTILSKTNSFIKFDSTSAEKDAMQTTIPFIDAQPVSPKDGTWLAGIGLHYKGYEGYGGFIGFEITDFDFTDYLRVK